MSLIDSLDLRKSKPEKTALSYDSSADWRTHGTWSGNLVDINDEISDSFDKTLYRIRDLSKNYAHFKNIVRLSMDYIINAGIKFKMNLKGDDGKFLKELNRKIELEFEYWAKPQNIDFSGRLHLNDMMRLAKRQEAQAGNYFFIRRLDKKRRIPVCYQAVDVSMLSQSKIADNIVNGVEYEKSTGRIIRYHFEDSYYNQFSVKADDIIHGFETVQPGQVLGISDLTDIVMLGDSIKDILNSDLDRKALQGKILAFVKSTNSYRRQMGLDTDSTTNRKIEEFESAMIKYLNPGEEITLSEPPATGDIESFIKVMLQMLSVGSGFPYELTSGDYGNMSFSTARVIRLDLQHRLQPIQDRFVRQFCEPIAMDFLKYGVLSGNLDITDFFTDPIKYYGAIQWVLPKMPPLDSLKEAKASTEGMKTGVLPLQKVLDDNGVGDIEDVIGQYDEAMKLFSDIGIDLMSAWGSASTQMQNNPAAV